jgi:hypothetical protein
MTYLSRDQLLSGLTTLVEQDLEVPLLGGIVRIKELTAHERIQAGKAANASGSLDMAVWYSVIIQQGVIDPQTKAPMFGKEDIAKLMAGRFEAMRVIAEQIIELGEMSLDGLKSSSKQNAAS